MRRVWTHRLLLLSGVALAVTPSRGEAQGTPLLARAPEPARYARAIADSRMMVDSVMRARNIPGLSIAVSVDGAVVWSEGFGWANVESQAPVTTISMFRIGSISKTLTAAALGQLMEQGKLDLDAPIQRYVPSFPPKAKGTITARLLAGHLSGIRHYNGDEFLLDKRYETVTAGLEVFAHDTLLFTLGAKYSYSTYGWNLLSAAIEGASGETFLHYMRAHVFEPLHMRHTVADLNDSIIIGRTGFYVRANYLTDGNARQLVNAPHVDNSYKWAGGGYLSTPEDLVRYANAYFGSGLLQPETVRLLWTSQRTSDGKATGYGMGWSVGTFRGHRTVGHGGGSIGGNSALAVFPDDHVVVALTTNISNGGFGPLASVIGVRFMSP